MYVQCEIYTVMTTIIIIVNNHLENHIITATVLNETSKFSRVSFHLPFMRDSGVQNRRLLLRRLESVASNSLAAAMIPVLDIIMEALAAQFHSLWT